MRMRLVGRAMHALEDAVWRVSGGHVSPPSMDATSGLVRHCPFILRPSRHGSARLDRPGWGDARSITPRILISRAINNKRGLFPPG